MECEVQVVSTWTLLACLFGASFSLPGAGDRRSFPLGSFAPRIGYYWYGNRLCFCAPVWDLLWRKAVSKSGKAVLKVLITCAGCLVSSAGAGVGTGRQVSKCEKTCLCTS